jgi:hypothetical protein
MIEHFDLAERIAEKEAYEKEQKRIAQEKKDKEQAPEEEKRKQAEESAQLAQKSAEIIKISVGAIVGFIVFVFVIGALLMYFYPKKEKQEIQGQENQVTQSAHALVPVQAHKHVQTAQVHKQSAPVPTNSHAIKSAHAPAPTHESRLTNITNFKV